MAFCKYNKNDAEDLLSTVILELFGNKKHTSLENAFKRNFFVYIYSAMHNLVKNPTSTFNKLYHNNRMIYCEDVRTEYTEIESDDRIEDIFSVVESNEFRKLFSPKDYWYGVTLWKMYYMPEYELTMSEIKQLNVKEINTIRKTSFRKIGTETGIDFRSINKTIVVVNEKIMTFMKK